MFSQALLQSSSLPEGGVTLTEEKSLPGLLESAAARGFLAVQLPAPGPGTRASLSLHIEEAIEVSLCRRGAAAPGVGASVDLDASLSDQLYRARLIEFKGIALGIPNLEGITNLGGTLDAEDSQALRWWLEATGERPVLVFVDRANLCHSVYPAPVPFEHLLDPEHDGSREASPVAAPEQAASSAAMDLSEPPPGVVNSVYEESEAEQEPEPEAEFEPVALHGGAPGESILDSGEHDTSGVKALGLQLLEEPETSAPDPFEDLYDAEAPPAPLLDNRALAAALTPVPEVAAEAEASDERLDDEPASSAGTVAAPAPDESEEASSNSALADDELPTAVDHPPPTEAEEAPPKSGPVIVKDLAKRLREAQKPSNIQAEFARVAKEQWKTWVEELEATRGPKPLAVVERTFVSAYVPLREAYTLGITPEDAREPLTTFATSFEQSYSEAFDALRVRGKRPTMVLDVPDIAQRIGRLHGARSTQLLLVDGMRFDLGLRIQDRLRVLARGNASLAERLLLWSALPTTTAQQLDLIGKGPGGLREPSTLSETSSVVARGKSATTLRRIKAAHRELYKLDVVEARLAAPGPRETERLDEIADEAAEALANHFLKLPPRTLVMVFGDHGFQLDALDAGTTAARSGGATPEEVLVPAFAWLIGNVH